MLTSTTEWLPRNAGAGAHRSWPGYYEDKAQEYRDKANETQSATPIILDLDGDGIEVNHSGGVAFDFDRDQYREVGAWVGPDDGFLVRDTGGDNTIDQAAELVLSMLTPKKPEIQTCRPWLRQV